MSADMMNVRGYVTANDCNMFKNLPEGIVSVTVSHSNLNAKLIELKFDLHQTIDSVKTKIYKHCGTSPGSQRLQLKSFGKLLTYMDDNSRMLGYYGVESGMEIHVVDTDPFSLSASGGLEDVSLIEKYRMSEEEYDKRKGTLRSWIREQQVKNPNFSIPWTKDGSAQGPDAPPPGPESVEGMSVGSRCEIAPGGRRGTIMFLGEVEEMSPGYWVGVRFDEPVGRGNGTVKGKFIFKADDRYGGFIRPRNVTAGDFPEKDILNDDDDDDDDEI